VLFCSFSCLELLYTVTGLFIEPHERELTKRIETEVNNHEVSTERSKQGDVLNNFVSENALIRSFTVIFSEMVFKKRV